MTLPSLLFLRRVLPESIQVSRCKCYAFPGITGGYEIIGSATIYEIIGTYTGNGGLSSALSPPNSFAVYPDGSVRAKVVIQKSEIEVG